MDDVADTLVLPSCIICAFRIGCLLHVLHLPMNAGMENLFFMGFLGKGAWHNWPRQRLVSLLGIIWYNTNRSDVANTTWRRYKTDSKLSSISSPQPRLPVPLGLRACPLQGASSAVFRPPIQLPHHSTQQLECFRCLFVLFGECFG